MLNIQLFLENQEVELNNKVQFPLNKSFENLWNPTNIIVEYSKSINIPATAANNRLMANAYRIDRKFAGNTDDQANIGLYLDPLKRIPMKLIYNGSIVLDGYAKYTSSTVNDKQTYYTFNLYGALGDIFQTLMDCVVDENKLTEEQKAEEDKGAKYVIQTPWSKDVIDRYFVNESWNWQDIHFDNMSNPHNNIGMAPAYRGLYDDFESTSAAGLTWRTALDGSVTETTSVEDELKKCWKAQLRIEHDYTEEQADARIDALDYDAIVPKGLNEHQLRQFRSYEQKPYIYISSLMRLFENKCKELTGYTINLDPAWFSANNPYYANLCYMLDYLSVKGNTLQQTLPFTGYSSQPYTLAYYSDHEFFRRYVAHATYTITDTALIEKNNITVEPFTIGLQFMVDKDASHDPSKCFIKMQDNAEVFVVVKVNAGNGWKNKFYWGATGELGVSAGLNPPVNSGNYTTDNFIRMANDTKYDRETNKLIGTGYITIPSFEIEHTTGNSIEVEYEVSINCTGPLSYSAADYIHGSNYIKRVYPQLNDSNYKVIFPNTEYDANWRTSTTCALSNLYTKDEPLFKVILQYTKMMGLIWKADYQNKKIDIMPRSKYFNDYSIVDWTSRVDKSKGLTIEPVSFSSKYVTFNYEDTDGFHYSGYKKKYGVDYGEKKIRTKYNFDLNETNLFEESIHPSSVSCKSFVSIDDLIEWDTIRNLPVQTSEVNFIDSEDDDEESAISLNNWYFRGPNKTTDKSYYIADVFPLEVEQNKYFWVGNNLLGAYDKCIRTNVIPQFSPVYKSTINGNYFGCLFNCPNEDYTSDKQITNANGNYIYDVCWADYINERYNANNKKVTCYVKLNPNEFQQFNFKTFVVIDNQLFVVNKIFDYDVNSTTTKVELIQVTNINGYTTQRNEFPELTFSVASIYITTESNTWGTNGSASIRLRSFPVVEYSDFEILYVSRGSENSYCYTEDLELDGNTTDLYIMYESDGTYTEEWELVINKFGKQYTIPIYIN